MPMETNSTTMTPNIQPVQRPRPGAPTTISRRGDASGSPFAPRTDVNIKNSVSNMAGILAKVSENQETSSESLSPQLQKLIDNIMKQSFSLESTLANGLGSSMESQRFAVDQLLTLSRLLNQLGSLAEQGVTNPLDSGLEAVLANFRELISNTESGSLEPAILHKLAFQLLDTKTVEDLPEELKFLLLQGAQTPMAQSGTETESLGFLKQLMQYFMPSPDAGASMAKNAGRQAPGAQGSTETGAETGAQEGSGKAADAEGEEPAAGNTRGTASGNAAAGQAGRARAGGQPSSAAAQNGQPGKADGQPETARSNGQETTGQARGGQEASARPGAEAGPRPSGSGQQAGNAPGAGAAESNASGAGKAANPSNAANANANANANASETGNAAEASRANRNTDFQKMPTAEDLQSPAQRSEGQPQQQGAAPRSAGSMPGQPAAQGQPQTAGGQPAASQGQPAAAQGQPAAPTPGSPAGTEARPAENSSPFLQPEDNVPEGSHPQASRGAQTAQQAPQGNGAAVLPRSLPMANTPQTMETMKQLASLLLKDAELTDQDQLLLQNFVNNREGVVDEKSAKQLQLLLRLCQNNIPASVQQAAQQQNLPDLPKLWAFMQLCNLAYLKEKNSAASLKRAGKNVATFASMMKGSMTAENHRTTQGQRSMNFMMPIYMGEGEKTAYPTYIHVYDEEQEDPEAPGRKKKETWLRVCLLTENIGAVDVTFRIYDESSLDVRVFFSDPKMVEDFREYVPEFRQSFKDTPLNLMELKINAAGDKQ